MTARLARCAVSLALAVAAPADHTGLFQISKGSEEDVHIGKGSDKASSNALSSSEETFSTLSKEFSHLPPGENGYAPDDYKEGMLVEAREINGTWVLGTILGPHEGSVEEAWDMKLPEHDEHFSVPAELMRRRHDEREADWLVVDKGLVQPQGPGLAYRRSKNWKDVEAMGTSYVRWDNFVVGRDEGDGWLKTSRGYLPMEVRGVPVLQRHDRQSVAISSEVRHWYLLSEEARRKAALAEAALVAPPARGFVQNERVFFQDEDGGEWVQAEVAAVESSTYKVHVKPTKGKEYDESGVEAKHLRKAEPPMHRPTAGESPVCRNAGGCVDVQVKVEGKEHTVRAAMGKPLQALVGTICSTVLNNPWSCSTRLGLYRGSRRLSPGWRTFEAGIEAASHLDVRLAPASLTPVGEP